MRTANEEIRVDPTARAADGSHLEPEEMPAIESFTTPVEVNLANAPVRPGSQGAQGSMRGLVGDVAPAIEFAVDVATRCELCAHWRGEDYAKHLAALAQTPKGLREINALRGELLGRAKGEALAVDQATMREIDATIARDFAICAAFTEETGHVAITPSYGGCPTDDPRFKARDRAAQSRGSRRYDAILRLAQGRMEG